MLKKTLLSIALAATGVGASAQQPPTGGSQIQQNPPPRVEPRPAPGIRIEQSTVPTPPGSDQTRILVNTLHITGQALYPEAELLALTGFNPGSQLTLADMQAMAAKIADFYRSKGYFAAQAYLPAQDIQAGSVTIAVLEGHYGKVVLRNESKLADPIALGLLAGLNSGDTIAIAPLEERLLLLSDIPGVVVRSTLVPGASVGASDLIVDVVPGRPVTGSIDADNHGNRYTGEYRLGATVNINNPTGRGDVVSLRGMVAQGLTFARASYQLPIGRAQVGVAYTALEYRLGREFARLRAHGTAEIASIYASYPLIRSRNTNLYALVDYDAKVFQDKIDSTVPPSVTDKRAGVLIASLYGDHRDLLGGGGRNSFSLTWSTGEIDIRTPAARTADSLTARSNGHYDKLSFAVARLQTLPGPFSLYGAIRGQVASKNLDISEKMELGGANAVRAYPEGEAYADQGYVATLEARMLLPKLSERQTGEVQLVGFVDTGSVTINKNPWAPGQNTRTLSGAGVGLVWADYNNFIVRAYLAHKLGNAVATSAPDANNRFWIQGVKYF